jgi:choline dehydrogenase-like flavoprotein
VGTLIMSTRSFDYIVVGGGSAGCVLARRLSDDPDFRVLLLEAGGRDWHPYIHMPAGFAKLTGKMANWGWSTVPQQHLGDRRYWYPQGRILGGGSSINAQVYTRGNAKDYDEWATEEGCAGWSYADVLPYFKRAEDNQRLVDDYHGYGGPLGVSAPLNPLPICDAYLRAAQEAGLPFNPDFNGRRQDGCGYYQLTIRGGRRCSAAVGYLKRVKDRANLEVRTGVMTARVVLERGRAVGVEVIGRRGAQPERLHVEREVLLSAGAIGSPKLLLLSGIGPADDLAALGIPVVHDLPGVGRNLQDHLDLYVVSECTGDHTYDRFSRPHRMLWAGLQYVLFGGGPVASNLCEAGGFWYADPDARSPDIQFHLMLGSGIEKGAARLRNCGVTLNSAFLRPRARGSVTLASADPFAEPRIDPNYWGDPYDRAMSIRGLRLAREIMHQPAFRPFVLAERMPGPEVRTDEEIAAYAIRYAKTDYHPVGTCKMGIDGFAVVDPALRVKGVDGLRVCDSSIMPRLVSSNTNAPTIMIAEMASDLIRGVRPSLAAAVQVLDPVA